MYKRIELRLEAAGWCLYGAAGTPIDISASVTRGLQEAFNALAGDATELHVLGGGVMDCHAPIYLPSLHMKSVRIAPMSIAFGPEVTGDALVFDSSMQIDFDCEGEIVGSGSGAVVLYLPRSPIVNDPDVGIKNFNHRFKSVIGLGQQTVLVRAITQHNGICHGSFHFDELRGGAAAFQVCETGQGDVGFFGNRVVCPHVHAQTGTAVSIGNLGAGKISNNQWDLIIAPPNGGCGLETMEQHGDYRLSVFTVEGLPSVGLRLLGQSNDNLIMRGSIEAQTPIIDYSGGRNRIV